MRFRKALAGFLIVGAATAAAITPVAAQASPAARSGPDAGGEAFVGHLVLPGHNAEWCLGLPANAEGGARFVIARCGHPGIHQVFIANRFRGSMLVGLANLPWVIGTFRGPAVVAINSESDPGHTRWLFVVNKAHTTLWSMAAYWLRNEPAIQYPEAPEGNNIYGLNFSSPTRGWQPWISFFGHWRVTDTPRG